MTVLQGLWRDLVDKQLWPLALGLGALAAFVPVLLAVTGPSADPRSSAALSPSATTGGPRTSVVAAATDPAVAADGPLRNPLIRNRPADAGTAAASVDGSSPTSGGTTSAPNVTGGDTFPGGSSGTTGTPDASSPASSDGAGSSSASSGEDGYDVSLRFGTTDSKSYSGVARLTPLPSAESPTLVYLGVLTDGKTAVFMVSEPATAIGDGTCRPKPEQCDTLEMREGDTQFLDVTRDDTIVSYRLDLTDVKKVGAGGNTITRDEAESLPRASASAAAAGRAAISRARRTSARRTLDLYRYLPSRGMVVRRPLRRSGTARLAARKGGPVVASRVLP